MQVAIQTLHQYFMVSVDLEPLKSTHSIQLSTNKSVFSSDGLPVVIIQL